MIRLSASVEEDKLAGLAVRNVTFFCCTGGFSASVLPVTSKSLEAVSSLSWVLQTEECVHLDQWECEVYRKNSLLLWKGQTWERRDQETGEGSKSREQTARSLQVGDHTELILTDINHIDKGWGCNSSRIRKHKWVWQRNMIAVASFVAHEQIPVNGPCRWNMWLCTLHCMYSLRILQQILPWAVPAWVRVVKQYC